MTRLLSVISSNIRYDEPHDEVHSWKNRRDFLASRLLDFAPDLLATQEGKLPQIRDIDNRLSGLTCVDVHRRWVESLMYPCLFYNPATLSLESSGDIWLSESPSTAGSRSFGSAFPRLCTWASFDEGIFAINVHLDNSNSKTRLCQIRVLIQQIAALKNPDQAIVLMGDFNESPECPVRTFINNEWPELRDPWIELGYAEESSHHHFFEPIDYGSRVDWILANAMLEPQEIMLDKSRSDRGIYPSDHYILKCRFLWRDTP
jgi:endonuclease/exonuclease/phosphatase family metal-dependent hydrolase